MTLSRLAAAVTGGRITATALVTRSLERIERANPELGAVVTTCADRALARAVGLDRGRGDRALPLAGLPVLVKDSQEVAGLPTSYGSRLFAGQGPSRCTAIGPERLEAAGAIVVGKTNVPELCAEGFTDNPLFGSTGNPWDARRSPGGSSGGSAAALSAGLCAIAAGTDGGGSIRIPAAWCGLLGLKPTLGLVGRRPIPDWMDLTTDGVLAQRTDDLRLLLGVLAGPVDGDLASVVPAPRPPSRPASLLAMPRFAGREELPDAVADVFWPAAEELAGVLGVPLVRAEDPLETGDPGRDWFLLSSTEQASSLGEDVLRERAEEMDPLVHGYLMRGSATGLGEYVAARRRRYAFAAELDGLLGGGALIVSPTVTIPFLEREGWLPGRRSRGTHVSAFNTMVHNLTGHPALSLPAGRLDAGLPFGLQVTARRWDEDVLIEVAGAWERAHPWPPTAPAYRPFDLEWL